MTGSDEPELLRAAPVRPPADSALGGFVEHLRQAHDREFDDYADLHRWSVQDPDGFWGALAEHFGVRFGTPPQAVLGDAAMPGARWFPGATLNYAEHAVGISAAGADADEVAVIGYSQTRDRTELTWGELREQVAAARAGLRRLGVRRGDRVAGYLPNIAETVVAFLATASLGAIWTSCAPEFGASSVLDRFGQVEPVVLLAVGGYGYAGKQVDRREQVAAIRAGLPGLRHVVDIGYGPHPLPGAVTWGELLGEPGELAFDPVPFDHPLCVLFSSGTTGKPKAIVHGHGGILLEHLKNHALSWDLGPGDRILWFSTTAWMMWNALVSGLLRGASIVLVDGNPQYPDLSLQWRLAAETGATLVGASPGFLMACRAADLRPAREHDLSRIRQLGAAGSPLPPEGYRWVAEQFGAGVLLNVGSGGTDICSGILQGGPWQPVWAGEISGPCLGVDARAFDEHGTPVVDDLGELVITRPLPSMPVGFWGDDDGSRYRSTYFDRYPGVWRHGDWVRFTAAGSAVVAGRSDATLNRGGVRLGTAEFYRVVEELPGIDDSLVLHMEDRAGGNGELMLFVQLRPGAVLDDALRGRIVGALRTELTPRHVPDRIEEVPVVPRNRTGKKLEVPAKRILLGAAVEDVASRDVLADPVALDAFADLAGTRA
ncbi:acetoacetyl-CoA synthetase [Pseudonocardia autotrophica]|uniref:Acetyl-coenzyme A synthetase n=1 Tax=Pseudonocardia autotrophica TaxID=2074 RepID=A0A1Y2MVK9_PSEAH|nr:acetoacetate--CoA ligase [Pseudonocardia autotrophica]OSY39220.1 Acetyl-coenzyme A synthetase [Pseudonocardia autotrophica]TDN76558.1 acetoacetyl-CoA synthetase [Pseudonocardia autotrophica]